MKDKCHWCENGKVFVEIKYGNGQCDWEECLRCEGKGFILRDPELRDNE